MPDLSSGVWDGHYEQFGEHYPQRMTLEFADGLIRGDGADGLGTFTLDGEYRVEDDGVRIGCIKTYDNAHSVLYLGTLVDGRITGQWRLPGGRGEFALSATGTGSTTGRSKKIR